MIGRKKDVIAAAARKLRESRASKMSLWSRAAANACLASARRREWTYGHRPAGVEWRFEFALTPQNVRKHAPETVT